MGLRVLQMLGGLNRTEQTEEGSDSEEGESLDVAVQSDQTKERKGQTHVSVHFGVSVATLSHPMQFGEDARPSKRIWET